MKGGLPFSETDSLSISSSPQEVHSGVDLISSSELETPNGRGPLLHRQIFFKRGLSQPVKLSSIKSCFRSKRLLRPSILISKGSEKQETEMLQHRKQELTANQIRTICHPWADWPALVSW